MSAKKSVVKQLLAKRKPSRQTVRLLLDGTLADQIEAARHQLKVAKAADQVDPRGLASRAAPLEVRLAELRLEAEEASTAFTFEALGRVRFQELKREYPPTEEQWERYRERVKAAWWAPAPEFEELTFAPALIATCCVDPAMTIEDAQALWDELSDGEAAALYAAALAVNEEVTSRPFSGTDTVTTPSSGPDSTTQQNGESPFLSLAEGS